MVNVQELRVVNSKVDKVLDRLNQQDTELRELSLEGNHLLALPDNFDYQVEGEVMVELVPTWW